MTAVERRRLAREAAAAADAEQRAEYIRRVVAAAPPLTEAQKEILASIFRGAAARQVKNE